MNLRLRWPASEIRVTALEAAVVAEMVPLVGLVGSVRLTELNLSQWWVRAQLAPVEGSAESGDFPTFAHLIFR